MSEAILPAPVDLAAPALRRLVLRLALPALVGLSITGLHHVVNAFFIGMLGTEALAAIGSVLPMIVFMIAIGEGVGVGVAACLARYLGDRRPDLADRAASLGLVLALGSGVLTTILLLVFQHPLLRLFGAGPETLGMAATYATVATLGCTLMFLQMLADSIAIAEGNTRFSMWVLLGCFTLNIVLDPILIFGAGLGLGGAAIATILSQVAALLVFGWYFGKRRGRVRLRLGAMLPDRQVLRTIAGVGLPVAGSTMLTALSLALVYHAASVRGGPDAVAAIGVAQRLLTFGLLPVAGFCLGAQPVMGFAAGAGDQARLRATLRLCFRVVGLAMLAYGLLMAMAAPLVAGWFTDDPAVRETTSLAIFCYHLAFAVAGAQPVIVAHLQARDRPLKAALISLAPQGYLLIPLLGLLAGFGVGGIIAATVLASCLTSAAAAWLLRAELRGLVVARDSHAHAPPRRHPAQPAACGSDYAHPGS